MINWEKMRGLSFINLKITKAKDFAHGIQICTAERKRKQNGVYERIKTVPASHSKIGGSSLEFKMPRHHNDPIQKNKLGSLHVSKQEMPYYSLRIEKIANDDPLSKVMYLKKTLRSFRKEMIHTRKKFHIVKQMGHQLTILQEHSDDYLQTEDQRDASETMAFLQQLKNEQEQNRAKRAISLQEKARRMQQPLSLPFTNREILQIAKKNAVKHSDDNYKARRMISSLYAYKQKMTSQQKGKVIQQLA